MAMEKTKIEVEKLKELSDKLRGFLEMECCASMKEIETKECGEVVDMIKDLAEAKKCCWEALYYQTVCEAMKNGEQRNGSESWKDTSMGYNTNRYASGRYAPSGHGDSTMGYPYPEMMGFPYNMFSPYMMDEAVCRMGYSGSSSNGGGNNSGGSSRGGSSSTGSGSSNGSSGDGRSGFHNPDMMMYDPRYGESFNRYREAKRHYTETHSTADKEQMDSHAEQHMKDAMDTTKEVYKSASPELKKKYKEELLALVNSLPVS